MFSEIAQRNIEIELYGEKYDIINVERQKIEFNELVKWDLLIENDRHEENLSIEYETPAIFFNEQDYVDGFQWYKTITLETDYDEGYTNISFNTTLPTTKNYSIDKDISYKEASENQLNFFIEELKERYEFLIQGDMSYLNLENISFEYLYRVLEFNGTEYEFVLNQDLSILIPLEYYEDYDLVDYEIQSIVLGKPVVWELILSPKDLASTNSLENLSIIPLDSLEIEESDYIFVSYETPAIFIERKDHLDGLNWTSQINLTTDFSEGYNNVDIRINIPWSIPSSLSINSPIGFDYISEYKTKYLDIKLPHMDDEFGFELKGILNNSLELFNETFNTSGNFFFRTKIKNKYQEDSNDSIDVWMRLPTTLENTTTNLVKEETELEELEEEY
ncbi:MAG: hypothetical protein KAQ83_04015, partial [Nanoarchaeota archaeon]|nr:hypothetical protein [Nanoarchaeota archaeon]